METPITFPVPSVCMVMWSASLDSISKHYKGEGSCDHTHTGKLYETHSFGEAIHIFTAVRLILCLIWSGEPCMHSNVIVAAVSSRHLMTANERMVFGACLTRCQR